MAQKREITCDRCGSGIINLDRCGTNMVKEYSAKIHYWGVGQPRSYGEQRIDLCAECAEKFVEFLENRDAPVFKEARDLIEEVEKNDVR